MLNFYTPENRKILKFSNVFRGYRNITQWKQIGQTVTKIVLFPVFFCCCCQT